MWYFSSFFSSFFFPSRAIYFRNVKNKRLVNTLTSVRKSFTFYAGNDIAHCSICSVSIFVSQRFSTKGRSSRRIRHSNSVIEMAQWRATRCCSSAFSYDQAGYISRYWRLPRGTLFSFAMKVRENDSVYLGIVYLQKCGDMFIRARELLYLKKGNIRNLKSLR